MLERPTHLSTRQIQGRAFSELAALIRTTGMFNQYGEFTDTETQSDIITSSQPVTTGNDARVRELTEGGVQLNSLRIFYTVEDLNPVTEGESSGDIIVYPRANGERYRVMGTKRWPGYSESIGQRMEAQ